MARRWETGRSPTMPALGQRLHRRLFDACRARLRDRRTRVLQSELYGAQHRVARSMAAVAGGSARLRRELRHVEDARRVRRRVAAAARMVVRDYEVRDHPDAR